MARKVRITQQELQSGSALPWAVYDNQGRLQLEKGYKITQRQIDLLLKYRAFREESDDASEKVERRRDAAITEKVKNLFEDLGELIERLGKVFAMMLEGEQRIENDLRALCTDIQELCCKNPDACLGAVLLYRNHPYSLRHPYFSAILCELVSKRLEYDDQHRVELMCAALTSNISMLRQHDALNEQSSQLTVEQRRVILQHPRQSVDLLRKVGVSSELWLTIVAQHHERYAGSGYPAGLKGKDIFREAVLVSLADTYITMTTPRTSRPAALPREILTEFMRSGAVCDEVLYLSFIKELSIFPPGSSVMLKNGELAVVVKRGSENSMQPILRSVIDKNGKIYDSPRLRECGRHLGLFEIQDVCGSERLPDIDLSALWAYR